MKMFKDSNDINEKSVIGFLSFIVMTIFAAADITTGILEKQLVIDDTIFNSFVIITLGAFGVSGVEKVFAKKDKHEEEIG